MTWRRTAVIPALAVCVVVLAGPAGCDTPGGQGADEVSSSPVGRLLDERAEDGSPYREVGEEGAPQVTARLYADDGSVWAVDGEPVESTADITVSGQEPTAEQSVAPLAEGPGSPGGPGQA